jgi:hypothetical protein
MYSSLDPTSFSASIPSISDRPPGIPSPIFLNATLPGRFLPWVWWYRTCVTRSTLLALSRVLLSRPYFLSQTCSTQGLFALLILLNLPLEVFPSRPFPVNSSRYRTCVVRSTFLALSPVILLRPNFLLILHLFKFRRSVQPIL